MNKEKIIKTMKDLASDSIDTALPYAFEMLPQFFVNGLCVSLPVIGNICLSFKQNRDIRILTEKVEQLCAEQKKPVYEKILYIYEKEQEHSNNRLEYSNNNLEHSNNAPSHDMYVYKVDCMELILDNSFEYNFDCFSDFIDSLENPYINSDEGCVWITDNKITININGNVIKYSPEFHEIIEYVNDLLEDVGVSYIRNPIKYVKCF